MKLIECIYFFFLLHHCILIQIPEDYNAEDTINQYFWKRKLYWTARSLYYKWIYIEWIDYVNFENLIVIIKDILIDLITIICYNLLHILYYTVFTLFWSTPKFLTGREIRCFSFLQNLNHNLASFSTLLATIRSGNFNPPLVFRLQT